MVVKSLVLESKQLWEQVPILPFICWVTSGNFYNFFKLQLVGKGMATPLKDSGEFHEKSLASYSPKDHKLLDMAEQLTLPLFKLQLLYCKKTKIILYYLLHLDVLYLNKLTAQCLAQRKRLLSVSYCSYSGCYY